MRAPIIGYEVIDQRQKFTVYKIEVKSTERSWFVFRRYTDFTRLNDRLKAAYPDFQIRLPGKRWFKDNFEPEFIDERARGLQFFINNIMNHSQISKSLEVQEFFCLNDPPGPYDSLEESRAYCQHLENQAEDLKQKVEELTAELKMTKSQLVQARVQQEALVSALRSERTIRKKGSKENGNDSAQIEELMEKSEKMADSDGLKGKFFNLLSRHRTNSKGKMVSATGTETEEDKLLWVGSVEIAEHSSAADRMTSSKLVRRLSTEKRNPRTSTPVSNSERDSPFASNLEDSEKDTKKELGQSEKIDEESGNSDSAGVLLNRSRKDTSEERNRHRGNMSSQEPRTRSSKRDSGISVDASPTPST
ncbi:Sorting nexin-16 [Desmophyllum pertusum]|uniref:Sorting nexin-16 n=1 Tax=Desmophyllum pertusum TaxID=174260 RepID=A0A9W9YL02_9CNID|nr:Sorting nexin-16 [Desmophyllum pertusum]